MILTIEQMMPRDELTYRLDSLEDFVYDKAKDYDCIFNSIDGKIEKLYNLTGKFENCVERDELYTLKNRISNLESITANKYHVDNAINKIPTMEMRIIDLENKMRKAGFKGL